MTLRARDRWMLIAVFVLASTQFVGFTLEGVGVRSVGKQIRGLGLVSTAAPLPLVFSAHDGLETFAQTYAVTLHWVADNTHRSKRISIDSRLYGKVEGSYNRRNIYGAVFSHGPVVARKSGTELIDAVLQFGLCGKGVVLTEFGLETNPTSFDIESRPNDPNQPVWRHTVRCP